jgi:hypothetical protein
MYCKKPAMRIFTSTASIGMHSLIYKKSRIPPWHLIEGSASHLARLILHIRQTQFRRLLLIACSALHNFSLTETAWTFPAVTESRHSYTSSLLLNDTYHCIP